MDYYSASTVLPLCISMRNNILVSARGSRWFLFSIVCWGLESLPTYLASNGPPLLQLADTYTGERLRYLDTRLRAHSTR